MRIRLGFVLAHRRLPQQIDCKRRGTISHCAKFPQRALRPFRENECTRHPPDREARKRPRDRREPRSPSQHPPKSVWQSGGLVSKVFLDMARDFSIRAERGKDVDEAEELCFQPFLPHRPPQQQACDAGP